MASVLLNGAGKPLLPESEQACVDLLREILEQAEAGKIKSVAIAAVLDKGMATAMAGRDASVLNLGCDELKRKILDAVL